MLTTQQSAFLSDLRDELNRATSCIGWSTEQYQTVMDLFLAHMTDEAVKRDLGVHQGRVDARAEIEADARGWSSLRRAVGDDA